MTRYATSTDGTSSRAQRTRAAVEAADSPLQLCDIRWPLVDEDPHRLLELAGCDVALKERRESSALLGRKLAERQAAGRSLAAHQTAEAQSPPPPSHRAVSPLNQVERVQAGLAEETPALEAAHAQLLGKLGRGPGTV